MIFTEGKKRGFFPLLKKLQAIKAGVYGFSFPPRSKFSQQLLLQQLLLKLPLSSKCAHCRKTVIFLLLFRCSTIQSSFKRHLAFSPKKTLFFFLRPAEWNWEKRGRKSFGIKKDKLGKSEGKKGKTFGRTKLKSRNNCAHPSQFLRRSPVMIT